MSGGRFLGGGGRGRAVAHLPQSLVCMGDKGWNPPQACPFQVRCCESSRHTWLVAGAQYAFSIHWRNAALLPAH